MKQGTRLYINLTNKCNVRCPFCCMYSGPEKNTFINRHDFINIIDNNDEDFELQLEGGEPLLHKDIFMFIEYAISTGNCKKVIILSNGLLLDKFMQSFISMSNWYNIPFEFKLSINDYLENVYKKEKYDIYQYMSNLIFAIKYIPNISIKLNVRTTHENREDITKKLNEFHLSDYANVYYLQSYGRMSENTEYDKPVIVQNIANWNIYASDGKCLCQDLIARSEYEKTLK